jgi:hypothetical protein
MRLNVRNTPSRDGDAIWKTVDEFYQTYWSGLDCRIFANNILLAEIMELQFSLQEAVAPLFGYHDYVYSTVMHGARRVNGAFKINYVREAYLFELLRGLELTPGTGGDGQPTAMRRTDAFEAAAAGRADTEYLLGLASQDGTSPQDTRGRPRIDPRIFRDVASDFEKAIWRAPPPIDPRFSTPAEGSRVKSIVNDLIDQTRPTNPRFELQSRFNFNIIFGSVTPESINHIQREGATGSLSPKSVIPVTTSTRIVGVALNGLERFIDDSGRPIMEGYQFIARDVL